MYKREKMYLSIIAILCVAGMSFGDDSSQSQLICGTDGITYGTADDFKKAQEDNPDLEKKIDGPCWEEINDDIGSDGVLDLDKLLDQVVTSEELSAFAGDLMDDTTRKEVIEAFMDIFKAMAETDVLESFFTAYYDVIDAVLQRKDLFEKVKDVVNGLNEALKENPDLNDAVMNTLEEIWQLELHDSASDFAFYTVLNHFEKIKTGEL